LPDVIGKGRGVLVSEVTEGSPADRAGLRVHDVLIRYDDQDLYSPEQLVKRVRNDRPGKEIELQYVRAGKVSTAKLTLGEQPVQAPITRDWPGLMGRFDFPTIPFRPDALAEDLTKDLDTLTDGSQWTRFESMSVSKGADGKYRATVKYKDEKGDSIDREYVGTRQEVRDAIKDDEELPQSQKEQLLRSLDDRGSMVVPDIHLPKFRDGFPWNHELFSWPDVNF
jgi:C-terminal processing protease CtpA/Prc